MPLVKYHPVELTTSDGSEHPPLNEAQLGFAKVVGREIARLWWEKHNSHRTVPDFEGMGESGRVIEG